MPPFFGANTSHEGGNSLAMNIGIIGAMVGSIIGIAGGIVGTYFSIKNTSGPRERAFMVRAAIIAWLSLAILFAVMFLLPNSRPWLWILYGLLLPLAIRYGNKRQAAIRREEHNG